MNIINVKKIEELELDDLLNAHPYNKPYKEEFEEILRNLKLPSLENGGVISIFTAYYQQYEDREYIDVYPTIILNKVFKKTTLDIQEQCGLEKTFIKSSFSSDTTVPQIKDDKATSILSAHLDGHFVQVSYPMISVTKPTFINGIYDDLLKVISAYKLEQNLPIKSENKKLKL